MAVKDVSERGGERAAGQFHGIPGDFLLDFAACDASMGFRRGEEGSRTMSASPRGVGAGLRPCARPTEAGPARYDYLTRMREFSPRAAVAAALLNLCAEPERRGS